MLGKIGDLMELANRMGFAGRQPLEDALRDRLDPLNLKRGPMEVEMVGDVPVPGYNRHLDTP
jgi:hypothetical protein